MGNDLLVKTIKSWHFIYKVNEIPSSHAPTINYFLLHRELRFDPREENLDLQIY